LASGRGRDRLGVAWWALLVVLLGCDRATPVRAAPEGKADATPLEAAPPPVDAATDASTLLPVEDSCKVDADCDWIALTLGGDLHCCASCGPIVGNKAWVARVKVVCAAAPTQACPPLACPMAIPKPACKGGHCVAGW